MSAAELYLPPPDVRFRLLGYSTQFVLFSRPEQPQVGHHGKDSEYPADWFTIANGAQGNNGQLGIQSVLTKYFLYARQGKEPGTGHSGDMRYPETKFRFEAGRGKYAHYFRIISGSETAIISRNPDLYISNANQIWPEQYFTFLWEDMKIDRVEYDLNLGRIVASTPRVLANQTIRNTSSAEQEMSFSVNEEETHTSTFEYAAGLTLAVGTSFKAGLPFVGEAEVRVDVSFSQEWRFGQSKEIKKVYSTSFPVKAGPKQTVTAISTINKGDIEVPYTIWMSSKETGAQAQTRGMWRGVTTWDLRHTISSVDH